MKKKYFYFAAFFVVAFTFFGCKSVFGEKSVAFSLPEWDDSLGVGLEYWLIKTSDGRGERSVLAGNVSRTVTLEVDFDRVTAILAYPITSIDANHNAPFFKPAGCIYPYQETISYLQGFSSEILWELYACNANYALDEISALAKQFNWQKFAQTVEAKYEEAEKNPEDKQYYNPWNCNHDTIFSGIQNGSFSTSYINQAKSNVTSITLSDLKVSSNKQELSSCTSMLGSYVPENFAGESFVLPYNEQREFISICNGFVYEIFVTFLKKEKKIVLAINSIPL
ncbi:MAG: hypothetical protein HDR53_02905 [Treponema sp.]|nr:hypothetical protein [Treponema sp.]